jgi:hypothetical protein
VNFAKSNIGKFLYLKCEEFKRTPSGQWPCSIEEDIFISASLKERERERQLALEKQKQGR